MSIDGCIAGPNGEMDWMVGLSDDKHIKYAYELMESIDTILLGRKMTDVFISYWSDVINKPDDPWHACAKKMIETPKVVFTKTLEKSKWINTEIATGDIGRNHQVKEPKRQRHGRLWWCFIRFFLN